MRTRTSLATLFLTGLALMTTTCGGNEPAGEPDHISVDHILIGVKDPAKFPQGRYSAAEARRVAYELLEKLEGGADWAAAKEEHSEDRQPGRPAGGPYGMANTGVRPNPGETPRTGMVAAFGDVGFSLGVGEIGIADYNAATSPFGYHLIKRVK